MTKFRDNTCLANPKVHAILVKCWTNIFEAIALIQHTFVQCVAFAVLISSLPSKHEVFNQCWINFWQASQMVGQHLNNIASGS